MTNIYYKEWKQLKPEERNFFIKNPHHALTIRQSREIVIKETKKMFTQNRRNDRSDAFRHCFWSAILARDIGYEAAKTFTTAHENFPANPKEEKEMDLHNNGVGLEIGRYFKGANTLISGMCIKALNDGKLKIIHPSTSR